MTPSIKTFKEYLFQISVNSLIDPYEEEWDQFVDIENQKFEISFRELPVDKIFRNKQQPVTVDILETIEENEIPNKSTNIYINNTQYTHNVYNVNNLNIKLNNKYLPMEQPPSLDIDNRLYLVIIMCAYVSLQFLIT
jgi:hypothetical protein